MRSQINLGRSIVYLVDTYVIATGHSRRVVVKKLIDAALEAPGQPPLRPDRYLVHGEGRRGGVGGTVTLDEPPSWWEQIDQRARRYGESRSESARALVLGGAVVHPLPEREALVVVRRALHLISQSREAMTMHELGAALWPAGSSQRLASESGGVHHSARIVCLRLIERGLLTASPRLKGWRKTPL